MIRILLAALPPLVLLSACDGGSEPASQNAATTAAAPVTQTPTPGTAPSEPPASPANYGATGPATPAASTADGYGAAQVMDQMNLRPTPDVMAAVRRAVGHNRVRIVAPDSVVTMDMRPDRLNLETGPDGKIRSIRCG